MSDNARRVAKSRAAAGMVKTTISLKPEIHAALREVADAYGGVPKAIEAMLDALKARGRNQPTDAELVAMIEARLADRSIPLGKGVRVKG